MTEQNKAQKPRAKRSWDGHGPDEPKKKPPRKQEENNDQQATSDLV